MSRYPSNYNVGGFLSQDGSGRMVPMATGIQQRPQASGSASMTSAVALGKIGATVGLCGAAAANLRRLGNDEISRGEAAVDSLRTGLAAGLATAAAGYVASRFQSPVAVFAATVLTGTAAMYLLTGDGQADADGDAK